MTISTQISSVKYTGNGAQTVFAYAFPLLDAAHMQVFFAVAGVETQQTTGFTVSLSPAQVTFATPPATGTTIALKRVVPFTQGTDFVDYQAYSANTQETALDLLTMQAQQLKEEVDRSAKLPITSSADADALVADIVRIASSANNLDTVATNIASVNTAATNIAAIIAAPTQASNAATSATGAATSATNAAASATAAAGSATGASTSASNASTSAANAATSATNAASSATSASTSATSASTSATNAASSATSAASSATTATTQASNASTSATNAATSATNAATSATTATTQATNASNSATAAAASATNAATSAATATTAAANLPNATTAGALRYIKSNAAGSAWEYKTETEVRADIGTGGYASKTITANTTLSADTEYETGRNLRINHGVKLTIPASTKLAVRHYASGTTL